jgi:hypothetical protein
LRLVETGAEGSGRSVNVMELDRRRDLGEISDLGLTLPEAKQLLVCVQQEIVAAQARDHAVLRPECPSCGGGCHVKDWQHHAVATLFGAVAVRLPRFRCIRCGHNATGISWPSHCRSTPELDQLRAHLSALMPFRVAAEVLSHLLPVAAGMSPETLRGHTLKIGEPAGGLGGQSSGRGSQEHHRHHGLDLHSQPRRSRTASRGSRRQCRDRGRWAAGVRCCREIGNGHRGPDPPVPR